MKEYDRKNAPSRFSLYQVRRFFGGTIYTLVKVEESYGFLITLGGTILLITLAYAFL